VVIEGFLHNPQADQANKKETILKKQNTKTERDKVVTFSKNSEPIQKDIFKEKYEDDESIYKNISLFNDMREAKKQPKKMLVHNKFNEQVSKATGSISDFWTGDLQFHNGHDIYLVKQLEDLSKKAASMAKRMIQTDCCKKMETFLGNGFHPIFYNQQSYDVESADPKPPNNKTAVVVPKTKTREREQLKNDGNSIEDIIDMM